MGEAKTSIRAGGFGELAISREKKKPNNKSERSVLIGEGGGTNCSLEHGFGTRLRQFQAHGVGEAGAFAGMRNHGQKILEERVM